MLYKYLQSGDRYYYGSIASRPRTSVIGQQYFNTTDGYPIFINSNNAWVSATGSVVG